MCYETILGNRRNQPKFLGSTKSVPKSGLNQAGLLRSFVIIRWTLLWQKSVVLSLSGFLSEACFFFDARSVSRLDNPSMNIRQVSDQKSANKREKGQESRDMESRPRILALLLLLALAAVATEGLFTARDCLDFTSG